MASEFNKNYLVLFQKFYHHIKRYRSLNRLQALKKHLPLFFYVKREELIYFVCIGQTKKRTMSNQFLFQQLLQQRRIEKGAKWSPVEEEAEET